MILSRDLECSGLRQSLTIFFILFVVIHVYLVFYHDYVEGRGETSSMVGGWKFIEEEAFQKDKQTAPDRRVLTDEKK